MHASDEIAPDFKPFADAGKKLADLHLNYEQLKPWPPKFIEATGVPQLRRHEQDEAEQGQDQPARE